MVSPEEAKRRYLSSWIQYRDDSDNMRAIPPSEIVMYPDIFDKAWGWERLLPYEMGTESFYLDYLKEYHRRNRMDYVAAPDGNSIPEDWPLKARRVVDDVAKCSQKGENALRAAAQFCMEMEQKFMLIWNNRPVPNVKRLSQKIQERACFVIYTNPEFSEPAAAGFVCIAREAALACELLSRGAEATDREIILCNYIRQCALSLMSMEGPDSDASVAAMVAVAKEARKMCEWMVTANELYDFQSYTLFHEMGLCDMIRIGTFDLMKYILLSPTGKNKPYVIMDFGNKRNKRKSEKTRADTSDRYLSQEQPHERKYNLDLEMKLDDKDMKLDALAIDYQTGWTNQDLRDQSEVLTDARRELDNSQAERDQNPKDPACGPCIPKHPAFLDEKALLACIVRAISDGCDKQIKINSTLHNRLGKMLTPLHWRNYKKHYGKLGDFAAKHPELFVIDGDLISLCEGADHAASGPYSSLEPRLHQGTKELLLAATSHGDLRLLC